MLVQIIEFKKAVRGRYAARTVLKLQGQFSDSLQPAPAIGNLAMIRIKKVEVEFELSSAM